MSAVCLSVWQVSVHVFPLPVIPVVHQFNVLLICGTTRTLRDRSSRLSRYRQRSVLQYSVCVDSSSRFFSHDIFSPGFLLSDILRLDTGAHHNALFNRFLGHHTSPFRKRYPILEPQTTQSPHDLHRWRQQPLHQGFRFMSLFFQYSLLTWEFFYCSNMLLARIAHVQG